METHLQNKIPVFTGFLSPPLTKIKIIVLTLERKQHTSVHFPLSINNTLSLQLLFCFTTWTQLLHHKTRDWTPCTHKWLDAFVRDLYYLYSTEAERVLSKFKNHKMKSWHPLASSFYKLESGKPNFTQDLPDNKIVFPKQERISPIWNLIARIHVLYIFVWLPEYFANVKKYSD